jgi:probable rRNA maturation factor
MVIFRKTVAGASEVSLGRFVGKTARAVNLKGVINVLVTGNRELQSLNRRFRGKDKPTDVLSFPPMADLSAEVAGDIAISADIAAKTAKRLGHSTLAEIKILVLHGVLHLAGYDHEQDNGAMAKKEQRLRASLGLPVSLIERSTGSRVRSTRPPR